MDLMFISIIESSSVILSQTKLQEPYLHVLLLSYMVEISIDYDIRENG